MYVTCKDLLKLRSFSSCRVLTGAAGMERIINWPCMAKPVLEENLFHGGELVVLEETYVPYHEATLCRFLDLCAEQRVGGILILINEQSERLKKVPQTVIDRACGYDLPLFQMSWDVRSMDVMKEVCLLIFDNEHRHNAMLSVLKDMIFFHSTVEEESLNQLANLRYRDEPYYLVRIQLCSFESHCLERGIISELEKHEHKIYLRHLIGSTIDHMIPDAKVCSNSNIVVALAPSRATESAGDWGHIWEELYAYMRQKLGAVDLRMCVGERCDSIKQIKQALLETARMIPLTKLERYAGRPVVMEQAGIYRMLLAAEPAYLRQIYETTMGPLAAMDANGDAELIQTLAAYLNNDLSLEKTSQQLYLHTNTIRYRLKKIESLTGLSMRSTQDMAMLYYCIHIKEYLSL